VQPRFDRHSYILTSYSVETFWNKKHATRVSSFDRRHPLSLISLSMSKDFEFAIKVRRLRRLCRSFRPLQPIMVLAYDTDQQIQTSPQTSPSAVA